MQFLFLSSMIDDSLKIVVGIENISKFNVLKIT